MGALAPAFDRVMVYFDITLSSKGFFRISAHGLTSPVDHGLSFSSLAKRGIMGVRIKIPIKSRRLWKKRFNREFC
jgi:hypothetical protein